MRYVMSTESIGIGTCACAYTERKSFFLSLKCTVIAMIDCLDGLFFLAVTVSIRRIDDDWFIVFVCCLTLYGIKNTWRK
jgi:hypothetical protein